MEVERRGFQIPDAKTHRRSHHISLWSAGTKLLPSALLLALKSLSYFGTIYLLPTFILNFSYEYFYCLVSVCNTSYKGGC